MVKKSAKNAADAEPNEDNLESKRLEDLAIDRGVLSRARRVASSTLPPSNLMLKADGKDVTKKSSARRNRYLLVFNCQLAPAAAGKLGTLANLDTKNPVMYLEFPEGRLRLRGTLVFPRNKYVVLKLGQKEVVCEDVMESMIVFSEAHWVGTVAENPTEEVLPMPEHLKTEKRHTKVEFGARGGDAVNAASQEIEIEETQEEDAGDAGAMPSQQPSQRRTSRQAGKKRRYAEDSDASLDDDDDDDSDRELALKKLPRAPSAAAIRKPKAAKPSSQPQEPPTVINLAADSDDSDEDKPLAARGKQSTLAAFFKKPATAAAKKASPAKPKRSTKKIEVIDLATSDSEEDEDEDDGAVPASQRPRRAAAGAASKKLKDDDDDTDEESEEDEGSDGGATSAEEEEEAEEASEYEEDEDMDDASEESDG